MLTCLIPFHGKAQHTTKQLKHELQFTAGLDSYLAFEFEPSYSYMFHKNIGITGGIRCIKEVTDNLHYNLTGGPIYQWRISNKKEVSALLFRPAMRFKIPIVGDWLFVVTEPGILLNVIPNEEIEFAYTNTQSIETPSRFKTIQNKGGQVLCYDMKNFVSVAIDNWAVSAGYTFSTFDIYSGRRNIVVEGNKLNAHLPAMKKCTHTGFIGISYAF